MADSPDAADCPEDAVDTACGRAVEIPAVGSDFPAGHMPLLGFFRVAQLSDEGAVILLVCDADAETVELDEAEELMEEDELVRCAVFRGPGMNILLMSSELILANPFCPPLIEFHPGREGG